MRDEDKSKEQLIAELESLRRQLGDQGTLSPEGNGPSPAEISETRYRQLFESMTSGVAVCEAVDGGQDFVFKDFNRAGEKIAGVDRAEIIGRRVTDVFPDVAEFGLLKQLQQVWQTGRRASHPAVLSQDERIAGWREDYVYKLPSGEIVVIYNDVTERKQVEEALARTAEINRAIAILSGFLISLESLDEVSTLVLAQARRLTDSQFGYVGYIDPQSGHLVCPTMTRDIWDECQAPDKSNVFEEFGGLWGWVLEHRKPLLINNVTDDSRSTGAPFGHMPVHRFLSAPALVGEKIVGQIALANGDRDYTNEDLSLVQRLATLYALAVQRTLAEEALQESEDRFRSLYASMTEGVALHEIIYSESGQALDYVILDVNPGYESIIGLTKEKVIGRKASEVYGISEPPYLEVYAEVAALDNAISSETYFAPMEKYFNISVFSPGRDQFATVFEDITERRRVEESRRREHDLLNRVMETSPVGITVADRTGRIAFANSRAAEILGLSEKEISGLSYNDPTWRITDYDGNLWPDEALPFRRVMATGQPVYDVRHAIEWPTGRRVLLSINAAPLLDRTGSVNSVVSVIEDVTARVRVEQQRRKQLEQELRSLDLLSTPPPTGVTAQMFGLTPLSQNLPDIFRKLVGQYEELLSLAVEQRLYKVEHHVSDGLRKIAGHLGTLQAGPRDVVECHSQAVKHKVERVESSKARVYIEEGRLAVLELMGHLTSYYRNRAMGAHIAGLPPEKNEEPDMTSKVLLKLYITGQTPRSEQAVANLRRICEQQLRNQFELDIVNILEQPDLAETERIIATPTLVRVSPPPARRIIGDLSDTEKVLFGLSLHHITKSREIRGE